MFTEIKKVTAVGLIAVGVGCFTAVRPAPVGAQPLPIPQDTEGICPDVSGVRYVLDPNNPDAYFVCKGGSQQAHKVCPLDTRPDVSTKPIDCPSDEGNSEAKP